MFFVNTRTSQVWSSDAAQYVPTSDALYQAYLAAGETPTPVHSEGMLIIKLVSAGLPIGSLTIPSQMVPKEVPMNKALRVMFQMKGLRESAVEAYINTLPEPTKTLWLIDFNRMTSVPRTGALVLAFQQLQGWTDAELDLMFLRASLS